jgi:hypothetical protein
MVSITDAMEITPTKQLGCSAAYFPVWLSGLEQT